MKGGLKRLRTFVTDKRFFLKMSLARSLFRPQSSWYFCRQSQRWLVWYIGQKRIRYIDYFITPSPNSLSDIIRKMTKYFFVRTIANECGSSVVCTDFVFLCCSENKIVFCASTGFTNASKPWLPINPEYWHENRVELSKGKTHLKTYRQLSRLRQIPTIVKGDLHIYLLSKWVFGFSR